MFRLHGAYFCNVDRQNFFRDMREKDWVILLQDKQTIVGFSTLQVIPLTVNYVPRIFVFSGDTIVEPAHWQDSKLAGSFGHFMVRQIDEHPDIPLYWYLISKGYRTYRFLPVYFKSFYPAFDRPTPLKYTQLIGAVSAFKYGDSFDVKSGLIRSLGCRDHLSPELAEVPAYRHNDPHVRFFLEKNPNYCDGDELACLADISKANLNKYAWRVIGNSRVMWDE